MYLEKEKEKREEALDGRAKREEGNGEVADLVTGDFGALALMADLIDDKEDLVMNLLQEEAIDGIERVEMIWKWTKWRC